MNTVLRTLVTPSFDKQTIVDKCRTASTVWLSSDFFGLKSFYTEPQRAVIGAP